MERMFMTVHSPGRPPKPDGKKRRQLHFSLYEEDITRLETLTDNRSEFIRQCIAQSWSEKFDGDLFVLTRDIIFLKSQHTTN